MIERTVGKVLGRNAVAANGNKPLIHAVGAQNQCGVFCDPPPKPRVDHHKIAVDDAALLASIVAEFSPEIFPA